MKLSDMLTNTCAPNTAEKPLTLSALEETYQKFREQFPLAGMEVVKSPFVPEGHVLMVGPHDMAIRYPDGKIVKMPVKDFAKAMRFEP